MKIHFTNKKLNETKMQFDDGETPKYIYGYSERSQIPYKFKIVKEDVDYYYVRDISTTWFSLKINNFLIDKENLKMVGSENKQFDFIVREMSILSFNEKDIIEASQKQQDEILRKEFNTIDYRIEKVQKQIQELGNVEEYKADYTKLSNLKRGSDIYVESKGKLYTGKVIGKSIYGDDNDNDYIQPIITCDNLDIYNAGVEVSRFDNEYEVNVYRSDSMIGEVSYNVYLSVEDYNKKIANNKLKDLKSTLNRLISRKNKLSEKFGKTL